MYIVYALAMMSHESIICSKNSMGGVFLDNGNYSMGVY